VLECLGDRIVVRPGSQPLIAAANRICLTLFGMQNMTFVPIWQPCIGSSLQKCLLQAGAAADYGATTRQTDSSQESFACPGVEHGSIVGSPNTPLGVRICIPPPPPKFRGTPAQCARPVALQVLLNILADEIHRAHQRCQNDACCDPNTKKTDFVFEAGESTMRMLQGSYSCICLVKHVGLVAFRDPYGIRCGPLVAGMTACLSICLQPPGGWDDCMSVCLRPPGGWDDCMSVCLSVEPSTLRSCNACLSSHV
jgi:hypothetical protein